jgi:hypothetical protein
MPQLDLDLMDDHLFLAFGGLLLSVGEQRIEESVIEQTAVAEYASCLLETASMTTLIRQTLNTLGTSSKLPIAALGGLPGPNIEAIGKLIAAGVSLAVTFVTTYPRFCIVAVALLVSVVIVLLYIDAAALLVSVVTVLLSWASDRTASD